MSKIINCPACCGKGKVGNNTGGQGITALMDCSGCKGTGKITTNE